MGSLRESFFRLKSATDLLETRLRRCLTVTDITLLGIGHMIGAGIYVLTGSVVHNAAGPSVVLSFALAGLASLLAALCYAEFGARFPKAGSAYTYAYIGIGELWAFIIGWNIILEHMLGAAAVARSWSGYLESLVGNTFENSSIITVGHFDASFFADYPDLIAFMAVVVVAMLTGLGSKTSTNFNSIFTVINMLVITFVVSYGFSFADFSLWTGYDIDTGRSRFFPFGIGGTISGAASCFFAYIGFDGLATAGEEASDPARAIPLATFLSMSFVTLAYILMGAVLTLMVPYQQVNPAAAFSDAFASRGANWAKYVVSVGALSGMTTSLLGSMFALPRCVYAMAEDGLIFKTFAQISEKTQVPLNAVVVFGAATSIIALLFDIETLVEFLSIGTLLAYTIVSACVIVLRYRPIFDEDNMSQGTGGRVKSWVPMQRWLNTPQPGQLVTWSIFAMITGDAVVCAIFATAHIYTFAGKFIVTVFGILVLLSFALICLHEQSNASISFKVPFVPLIPALSMLANILLMFHLSPVTWIRLVIWLAVGFMIYGFYGIRHSREATVIGSGAMTKSSTYESMVTDLVQQQ